MTKYVARTVKQTPFLSSWREAKFLKNLSRVISVAIHGFTQMDWFLLFTPYIQKRIIWVRCCYYFFDFESQALLVSYSVANLFLLCDCWTVGFVGVYSVSHDTWSYMITRVNWNWTKFFLYLQNGPLIILVLVWRKSIHFWLGFPRKRLFLHFSFPVTLTFDR